MRVYLSGPMTGYIDVEIASWREIATQQLQSFAEIIDPAVYNYDAEPAFELPKFAERDLQRVYHGSFVVKRNKKLIHSCDVVLANLSGANGKASIGSIGELFWADAFDKPIVIVREANGNVHDHAMLNAIAAVVCHSLEDAISAISELAGRPTFGKRTA